MNSQKSLSEQLVELINLGNTFGLYDAVDFLVKHVPIESVKEEGK